MKVSVVVTCYNYGRYLRTCLDSILAQTYANLEVVLVNDGSTDDTDEIVRQYVPDSRITYVKQANQGQTAAKNAGIRLSSGDIIAFLDADDYWLPEKLSRQMPLFDNPRVGVTYTGYGLVDQEGREVPFDGPQGYLRFQRGAVTRWLAFDNFVPFSATAVRRSLLDRYGAFDDSLRMGIDWDIWLRLSLATEFDFVSDGLIAYRVGHANQMSRNKDGRFAAADFIFSRFIQQHPDAISPDDLRAVAVYSACARAGTYRERGDLRQATGLLWKAVKLSPLSPDPYLGFLRNARFAVQRLARA